MMPSRRIERLGLSLLLLPLLLVSHPAAAAPPAPDKYLGFPLGADRKLATWDQVVGYFRLLADNSDRVLVRDLGGSTMGNPMIMAIISSAANIARLDRYREINDRLADPRGLSEREAGLLADEGKVVYALFATIHSTEISNTQMTLKLAYDLATAGSGKLMEILDNVILLVIPSQNPDGQVLVIDWYNRGLGTAYEGGPMPWLYHKYVGHDTNRDWFMFTQVETRISVDKVYNTWHPQITHDMHQAGRLAPRIFIPPYNDPLDPNMDPILVAETARIGADILTELTSQGKPGVVVKAVYDLWTPARAYMIYHGSIRLLSEIASCRLATPDTISEAELAAARSPDWDPLSPGWNHPLPFRGGPWSLADMIDYGYSAAVAALTNAARYRRQWLYNFYQVGRNAVAPKRNPHAFIIPAAQRDPAALYELLTILDIADVEIHRAAGPFSADGRRFAEGDFVIELAQPYGAFAKTMLEVQRYPDLRRGAGGPPIPPYDVTGHTLGYQLGVRTVAIERPFDARLEKIDRMEPPTGGCRGDSDPAFYLLGTESNAAFKLLNALLDSGQPLIRLSATLSVDNQAFSPGALVIPASDKAARDRLDKLARQFGLSPLSAGKRPLPDGPALPGHPVRLALYKPWQPSMDEGWTRFILEQYGFTFQNIDNERIRAGDIARDYDVMIIPDTGKQTILDGFAKSDVPARYSGGLRGDGVAAIDRFVLGGGTVIALNASTEFLIDEFHLPVRNVLSSVPPEQFFCPGSILLSRFDNAHALAWGMPACSPIFFRHSPAFILQPGGDIKARVIGEYPDMDLLMSGWILGQELIRHRANLIEVPHGLGRFVLIGFNVQHRAQFRATYKLLFNAIYYGSMRTDGVRSR